MAFLIEVLLFLTLGVVIFGVFAALPALRKFALSAALWCACWGPCVVAFEVVAGLSAMVALAAKGWEADRVASPSLPIASVVLALGFVGVVAASTVAAWLHQQVIGRMTFSLFRIYVMGVAAGMGSVAGLDWSVWLLSMDEIPLRWVWGPLGMLLLVVAFGYAGFRWARGLRGARPEQFQWVSAEEFEG